MLDEGKYDGKIVEIQERTDPYAYIDLIVEVKDLRIRLGLPDKITKTSHLGVVLQNFGCDPDNLDQDIDIEKLFMDKKVECLVKNKKTDRGTFSQIIFDTLKPKK